MRWALIPFILAALCNAVGPSHSKDDAMEKNSRISAEFASGVGRDVMGARSLSIVSRALLA
jgi:hypothetical protein